MNVILLTADALRADHLPCYGYHRETAPFLSNELTEQSAWFDQCYATANMTAASTPSILTGTYPMEHGGYQYLSDGRTLLSEVFEAAGYRTAAFHTNVNYVPERNYDRGFDYVYSRDDAKDFRYRLVSRLKQGVGQLVPSELLYSLLQKGAKTIERTQTVAQTPDNDAETLIQESKSWLKRHRSEDTFTWVHFMDTHNPFNPPEDLREYFAEESISETEMWELNEKYTWSTDPYTPAEVRKLEALYDGTIRYLDQQLQSFYEWIENTLDETLVVFTADHGELFGEADKIGHGPSFHEGVLQVPLFIWGLDVEPGHYDGVFSTVDIGKTILDLADISPPESYRGYSAGPALRKGDSTLWNREIALSESGHAAADSQVHSTDRRSEWRVCARDGQQTLVYHVASEDWTTDTEWNRYYADTGSWKPLSYDCIDVNDSDYTTLQESIDAHIERVQQTHEDEYRDHVELDDATETQLEELGYV